ncbi:MAG TPA: LytTR family DNA-binding domain-containing protein [Bacteroidales bacterium]|nr:LytTR family DNA-binding domain-containing protein [Bacteroidales bacterium]
MDKLKKRYPQNLIIRKPLAGTIILSLIWFVFITLYQPLGVRAAKMNMALTMAAYALIQGLFIYFAAKLLKKIPAFSDESGWTIKKEIFSVLIMLFVICLVIYFAGFIIEPPSQRWNISTFFDSCEKAILIGLIPFGFFTVINLRYLSYEETEFSYRMMDPGKADPREELIHVNSQLKKEDLSFYPSQFMFCEANGNYVVFHILVEGRETKKMIRTSISNIEKQLTGGQNIMRIHRTFIVNLNLVNSKKGNSLGYRIKVSESDAEIPVSRNNTKDFDIRMKHLR